MLVINGRNRDALHLLTKKFDVHNPEIHVDLLEMPKFDRDTSKLIAIAGFKSWGSLHCAQMWARRRMPL
jgi:hypothetical protein